MNTSISNVRPHVTRYSQFKQEMRGLAILLFLILLCVFSLNGHAFEVDLSHRMVAPEKGEKKSLGESILEQIASKIEDSQPIVILNTGKGFIPNTIRLKKDGNYKFYVANVNENEKNVSFLLDAFNKHHATYFGQVKVFDVKPKINGVFTFQCPETSQEGKMVVFSEETTRGPASLSNMTLKEE